MERTQSYRENRPTDQTYFLNVGRFGLMSQEEETDVARRWQQHRSTRDLRALVQANLRFVIKVAQTYRNYGFPLMDLIQEGNIGLIRAIERFDPSKGFRLISYAVWWIRASIQEYILRNWSLVKIGTTQIQRKLFNNLQSSQKRVTRLIDEGSTGEETAMIARQLGGTQKEVEELLQRFYGRDSSLDAPAMSGEDNSFSMMDRLGDKGAEAPDDRLARLEHEEVRKQKLFAAIKTLSERDRKILTLRHFNDPPLTLRELGDHLGVSKERVRQLEARAIEQLRHHMEKHQ